MKRWERFTQQEIKQFVQESISYTQLAEKLGYSKPSSSGSISSTIKQMIDELGLDISHFKGQGWNKDNFNYSRFKNGNRIKSSYALRAIVALRGYKCERCGLSEWLGEPIPLEVHHVDGQNLNSELENLILLCPNCHALTNNYRGRNVNNGSVRISDECFVEALEASDNIRQALVSLGLTAKGGNYARAYELIQKYQIEKFLVGAPREETSCVNDP